MSTAVTIPEQGLTDAELEALFAKMQGSASSAKSVTIPDEGFSDEEMGNLIDKMERPEPRHQIGPLPPKRGLGKIKAFFLGDPLTGETLPGQVISTLAGDRPLPLDSNAPLVKPEAFIQRPEGAVENVAHGTLKALGEFTTPANVLMLGGIAGAMGVVGKFGLVAVQRLISAGFSADMIHSLTERAPELKAAAEEKQDDEFWHIVGEMLPVGAMALGAGAHAARPGAKGPPKPEAKPVEKAAPVEPVPVTEPRPAAPKPTVVEPAPVAAPKQVEAPAAVAEAKPIEGPAGKEAVLHTPSQENATRYRIVEAESLQASHDSFSFGKNPRYPEGVQERNYHSNKNAQAKVIADSQNIKPEMVINTDPTGINGPPQVTPDGIVLGGNGRSMSLQRAYKIGKGEKYRKYLEENAAAYGLTKEQFGGMKEPVLVREVVGAPRDMEGLRVLGHELNKDFKKALTEVEEAVSAGKNLSPETADKIAVEFEALGDAGTLRKLMDKDPLLFRDALLKDNVLKESDLPKYFTELGTLNAAGKNFVENSLVGAALRDADLMQSLPLALVSKFERLVPQMIELGNRSDSWNIMGDVRDAARQVTTAQVRGIKLEDQLGQIDMFGGGVSPEVAALARTLAAKPTEVSKAFKQYVSDARTDVPGQAAMFGKADPVESFGRIFGLDKTAPQPAAATGTYAMASATRPTLPSVARATMPKELVRKSKIIADLSKAFGDLPIRVGRFREKALGIYKTKPEVVRTKEALDIPVVAHEVGHHINKVLYGGREGKLNWEPLKAFKDELDPIATKPRKGQSPLPEGFAEFVRLFLTRPGEAIDKAPRFHAEFQKQLAGQPELQAVLRNAREQIRRYNEQPAAAKVLAHISKEEAPIPAKRFDRLYTQFIDALHPIKKAVDEMAKRQGNQPPTEKNAYELARLFAGWSGKADHFINKGTFAPGGAVTGKGLREILKPVDGKLDDLRIYLVARRAIEKGGQDIKTGISTKDARDALKQVETPALKKVAEDVYNYNDQLLQYLVKSEFMSPAQYEVIKKMNRNYVPFYRVMEAGAGGKGGGGKSFGDLWNPVARMKGSTREIIDPLESIFKNTHTLINLAERNRIGQAVVRQAAKTEGGGQWAERVPAKLQPTQFSLGEIKKVLEDAGVDVKAIPKKDLEAVATVFRPNVKGSARENVITVFEGGKSELYQIQPDLYKVVKGLETQEANVLIDILSKPAKLLRLGATGVGPEFLFRNPLRDTWTAYIQSRNGFTPGVDNFRGLFHVLKKDDLFTEWQRSGGEHAALVSMDRKALVNSLKDMVASPMKLRARHPIETARMLSELLEASTRLGEYGKARARGKSAEEAALDSREVTLDFARIGSLTGSVNKISAFWNAQVQGADKFVRAHMENSKGTVAKATKAITLPSLMLYALNKDDPEYQDLPRWQKDFFWMVPTKGTALHEKTSFIPIPKPFLWGLVYGTSLERAAEWINEKDPKAFDGYLNSIGQASLPNPSPTAANIAYELWANKSSFTGRDIVPKYMQRIPAQHQFEPWTSAFSKRMAAMFKKAGAEVSPMKLDHLMFGLTAGGGRAAAAAVEPLLREEGEAAREKTMADIPGLRAFAVRKGGGGESMQRFYDRFEELDAKYNATRFAKRYKGRGIEAEPMTAAEKKEYGLLKKARVKTGKISGAIRKSTDLEKTTELRLKRTSFFRDIMARADKIRRGK